MKFENELKSNFQASGFSINPDEFIERFHQIRKSRERRKARIYLTVYTFIVLAFAGGISLKQLDNYETAFQYEYLVSYDENVNSESFDEYFDDMAYYLIDTSDDIWSTIDFFEEINYQPVILAMENEL